MRILKHFTANDQKIVSFPFKRELSMEAYIIENEDILSLDGDTLNDVSIIQEELTLKQGRSSQNTDGRIDILITYSSEYIGVVELKLGNLCQIHLDQLDDYLKQKEQLLVQFPDLNTEDATDKKWIGVLVGSSIDSTLADKISCGYTTDSGVQIAALTIQRFRSSNGEIFVTTDNYFKDLSKSRDTSKYKFEGKVLGKGRLVLAVLKQHIENHPKITYSELEKQFPPKLQGSFGVFSIQSEIDERLSNSTSSIRRHFMKANEIITLSDSKIYICNQWGIKNIDNFIRTAKELGYKMEASNTY
jgi:hypothetical protein